jgi:hypothetical protein
MKRFTIMYNSDTELLFPIRVIPTLSPLRNEMWRELVARISSPQVDPSEQLAFVLMMVRLGGCVTCSSDSFRAMRGCTQCAWQTIRRYRGTDQALLEQYELARRDVQEHFTKKPDGTAGFRSK